METSKFFPASHRRLQKFFTLRNYIFAILKDKTVILGLCQLLFICANFKVLSPASVSGFAFLLGVDVSRKQDAKNPSGIL